MKPLLFAKADPAETFGIGWTAVTDAGAQVRIWDAINDEPAPSLDKLRLYSVVPAPSVP